MSNIYLKVTVAKNVTYSKLRFSKFKKFVPKSVYGELQFAEIPLNFQSFYCNFVWLFYYFYFEMNYDVLKSKSPCFLLNNNINFNQNETESKKENLRYRFRDEQCTSASLRI